MKKEAMNKLSELSEYLDSNGLRDASVEVDHMLVTLAEIPSIHELFGVKPRETSGYGGLPMPQEETSSTQKPKQQREDVKPAIQDTPKTTKFVIIEAPGYEPIRVTSVSEIKEILTKDPNFPHNAIIEGIYTAIIGEVPEAKWAAESSNLQKAIEDGKRTGYLKEEPWYKKIF